MRSQTPLEPVNGANFDELSYNALYYETKIQKTLALQYTQASSKP